jgi:uncharacterized protein (TIGR03435 family)
MTVMLQTLLADRFQLKVHRDTKETIYELRLGKNAPKLKVYVGILRRTEGIL